MTCFNGKYTRCFIQIPVSLFACTIMHHDSMRHLLSTHKSEVFCVRYGNGWWRGTVVERRSLAGELSLSCARPAADG